MNVYELKRVHEACVTLELINADMRRLQIGRSGSLTVAHNSRLNAYQPTFDTYLSFLKERKEELETYISNMGVTL